MVYLSSALAMIAVGKDGGHHHFQILVSAAPLDFQNF